MIPGPNSTVVFTGSALAQSFPVYLDETKLIEERIEDVLDRMSLEEKVAMTHAQSKFSSPGVARLGIPEVWMTDGPHGIRPEVLWDEWNQAGWTNDSCVAFPALTCLAATWNPEVSLLYGKSIGEEARYRNKTEKIPVTIIFFITYYSLFEISTTSNPKERIYPVWGMLFSHLLFSIKSFIALRTIS